MKKIDFLILLFILTIGFFTRLYKINIPLADFHSWRQADTASVARNFLKNGFDLFHPKYDDLSNIQSGMENPQGYRMVELPIYNAIFAFLYKIFPFFSLEIWGRLTSIFFSLTIISIIYYLLLKEKNRITAFFGALTYAIFPFFVFYSRVILPETTALAFSMISILFLYFYSSQNENKIKILYYFLSLIFFSLSLLTKPTTIFFVFPLIYLFFRKKQKKILKDILFYLYFILGLIPLVLWRTHIQKFPEGIPANSWLLTSINTGGEMKKIFLRPAFFRWIFFERINNLILGGYLTIFLIIGIIQKTKKYFFHSFLISSIFYLFIFQGGNIQHDYYQTLILPSLSIFVALGINLVIENKKIFNYWLSLFFILTSLSLSWFFSFYQIKDHYHYSQELIQEANIIKSLTSPEDKIVVDRMGDTTLLYLSERKGAPAIYKDPKDLKTLGYKYLITSNVEEIKKLKKENYKIIFENDKFSIFKL